MQTDTFNPSALDTQSFNASRQQQALQVRTQGNENVAREAQPNQTAPAAAAQPQAAESTRVQISDAARQAAANDAPGAAAEANNPAAAQQRTLEQAQDGAPRHQGIQMFEQTASIANPPSAASAALRTS